MRKQISKEDYDKLYPDISKMFNSEAQMGLINSGINIRCEHDRNHDEPCADCDAELDKYRKGEVSEMTLEEKDKYIEEHLMKLTAETLRFMVADLHSIVSALLAELETATTKEQERIIKIIEETKEIVSSDQFIKRYLINAIKGGHNERI